MSLPFIMHKTQQLINNKAEMWKNRQQ